MMTFICCSVPSSKPFIIDKPSLKQPRAIVLGGCTSHNTSLSFRSFTRDIEKWAELDNITGWDVETINRCLDNLPTEIKRIDPDNSNQLFKDCVESCQKALDIPEIDFNKTIKEEGGFGGCVGYFYVAYDPKTGNRCSASVAYIHPLLEEPEKRPNLTILFEATVTRINLKADKKSVESINIVCKDKMARPPLKPTCEVILCAGSIDTPHLLLLSGIGPKEQFEEYKIPLQHELPGVGKNLQDHPEGTIMWSLNFPAPGQTVVYSDAGIFLDRTGNGADIMMHSYQVPTSANIIPVPLLPPGRFPPIETAPGRMAPFSEYAPYATTMTKSTYDSVSSKQKAFKAEEPADQFAIQPNTPNPCSRGSLYLQSSDPSVHPVLDFNYFSDTQGEGGGSYDLQTLVYAIRKAREVAKQEPFSNWIKEETFPGKDVTSDKDLAEHISQNSTTVYHPVGTTKMGPVEDETTVVDCTTLKVKGLNGLRVCDAGIIPRLTTIK